MIPVVTPAEMRDIDSDAAPATSVLIERAGAAVARVALARLGGGYGRRVVIVAGKGNNGADGRAAGRRLVRRGVRVAVVDAAEAPHALPSSDLVIDAAFGTGFHGTYAAPETGGAPVLAVDIPSGVSGDTGEAAPGAVRAERTVTFAALKPGLVLGDGPDRAGVVDLVDIGLDVARATIYVVEDTDVLHGLPPRQRDAHKWQRAVFVVAGSGGMLGAAWLTSMAALRGGAGMVRLGTPGAGRDAYPPGEVVGAPLPDDWATAVLEQADRFGAIAIGPGLGTSASAAEAVRSVVAEAPVPVVVDADGLNILAGAGRAGLGKLLRQRPAATVLTPHEGEFARLAGRRVGADRVGAVRSLACDLGATVLLKGSTTVVAAPDGQVRISITGSSRLATAGTGDVLTGVVAAFLCQGVGALEAAAWAAHAHGAAAQLGPRTGLVAGDLLELLAVWLSRASEVPTAL